MPKYMTAGAVGMDLYTYCQVMIWPRRTVRVALGIAVELPPGYEGQVRGRSSLAERGIHVHLGTVDTDYRGELHVVVSSFAGELQVVQPGERIAQLVCAPAHRLTVIPTEGLSETERGEGGFGSTNEPDILEQPIKIPTPRVRTPTPPPRKPKKGSDA